MSEVFFTSDLHFFHTNILKFCARPFENVDEMNKALVQGWNSVVSNNDTTYVLGDVSFGKPGPTLEVMAELNGVIKLVPGNHDRLSRTRLDDYKARCDVLNYYELLRIDKERKFVLCHFPFAQWERGWINLHGHTHGTYPSKWRQLDVGVDQHPYRPISVEEAHMMATLPGGQKPRLVNVAIDEYNNQ